MNRRTLLVSLAALPFIPSNLSNLFGANHSPAEPRILTLNDMRKMKANETFWSISVFSYEQIFYHRKLTEEEISKVFAEKDESSEYKNPNSVFTWTKSYCLGDNGEVYGGYGRYTCHSRIHWTIKFCNNYEELLQVMLRRMNKKTENFLANKPDTTKHIIDFKENKNES